MKNNINQLQEKTILLLAQHEAYEQIDNLHQIETINFTREFDIFDIHFVNPSHVEQLYQILRAIDMHKDSAFITIIISEFIIHSSQYRSHLSIFGAIELLGIARVDVAEQDIAQGHLYIVSNTEKYDLIELSLKK